MMKKTDYVAYIGLGANEGERVRQIREAIERIRAQMEVTTVASLYETRPIGVEEPQPWYINTVLRVQTTMTAPELLQTLLNIEQTMGRVRRGRWGLRRIDCDVLLYDNRCMGDPFLTVPHPRMMERAFVLVPLMEIMPVEERGWRPGFESCTIPEHEVKRWNETR